jgi:hypothetical protein
MSVGRAPDGSRRIGARDAADALPRPGGESRPTRAYRDFFSIDLLDGVLDGNVDPDR